MKEEDNILNHQNEENTFIQGLPKGMPYKVPADYFESLEKNIQNSIQIDEETETIAPLLNSLEKQMPYATPESYFDTISFKKPVDGLANVVSIQFWKRVMAAAVIIGIMVTTISIWNTQHKTDISLAIQHVNTEELVNQLDTSSGIIFTNADSDTDDNALVTEVLETQDELQLASDEDLQDYINDNIDSPFNNVDI